MGRRRSSELVVPGTAEQALNVGPGRKEGFKFSNFRLTSDQQRWVTVTLSVTFWFRAITVSSEV